MNYLMVMVITKKDGAGFIIESKKAEKGETMTITVIATVGVCFYFMFLGFIAGRFLK